MVHCDLSDIIVTVERGMLATIVFGGFENVTIWQIFGLEILLVESVWDPYFLHLVTVNTGVID